MATKPEPPMEEEQPKRSVGRPLKFETVESLDRAINAYFDMCDPHTQRRVVDCGINEKGETIWREREVMTEQKAYTISGLANTLDVSRQTLLNYADRPEFFDSIDRAKSRCEEYWEGRLDSPSANGAKFNLQNNYNGRHQPWADKQVLAGDPDAPLGNPLAELTAEQLRRLADQPQQDQPDGDPSTDQA